MHCSPCLNILTVLVTMINSVYHTWINFSYETTLGDNAATYLHHYAGVLVQYYEITTHVCNNINIAKYNKHYDTLEQLQVCVWLYICVHATVCICSVCIIYTTCSVCYALVDTHNNRYEWVQKIGQYWQFRILSLHLIHYPLVYYVQSGHHLNSMYSV